MRELSARDFESCVEEALASVPPVFRKYLENVVVVVEEEPCREDYDESDTPESEELFGIFRGMPFFDQAVAVSALPAQIVGVFFRYHTRVLNRNSLSVNAPTGQRSTTFPE